MSIFLKLLEKRLIPFILPLKENILGIIFNLNSINDQEYCLAKGFLHPEEQYKCNSFKARDLSKKFAVCRVLARLTIAKIIGVNLSNIEFEYTEFGRPFIANSTLDFNISHSKNLGIICWGYKKKVGVDIEYIDPNFDYQSILDVFAFKNEVRWILEKNSLLRFYQLWTTKESILKCSGEGLRAGFPETIPVNQILFYQNKKIINYLYKGTYYISICQNIRHLTLGC